MPKERIDVLLVEKLGVESREKAQKTIMAGIVYVDNNKIDKPGTKVDSESDIEIRGNALPYVSRGGLKLEKAIELYGLDLNEKRCMDIGASTGGFTDCMLQNGAGHVYSVDVGYGQLDWKLRNDTRVTNMERTNIRYVTLAEIGDSLDFISIDVSFISLRLVLPVASNLLKEDGQIVFLIKPQFEAGREHMKKSGVVRDSRIHEEVINNVLSYAAEAGIRVEDVTFSPIKGPKGNIEFLAYGRKSDSNGHLFDSVKKLVDQAHEDLNN